MGQDTGASLQVPNWFDCDLDSAHVVICMEVGSLFILSSMQIGGFEHFGKGPLHTESRLLRLYSALGFLYFG